MICPTQPCYTDHSPALSEEPMLPIGAHDKVCLGGVGGIQMYSTGCQSSFKRENFSD